MNEKPKMKETTVKVPKQKQESGVVEPVKVEGDTTPCSECGSIFLLRTGTCHVCQVCGASQGCS